MLNPEADQLTGMVKKERLNVQLAFFFNISCVCVRKGDMYFRMGVDTRSSSECPTAHFCCQPTSQVFVTSLSPVQYINLCKCDKCKCNVTDANCTCVKSK